MGRMRCVRREMPVSGLRAAPLLLALALAAAQCVVAVLVGRARS